MGKPQVSPQRLPKKRKASTTTTSTTTKIGANFTNIPWRKVDTSVGLELLPGGAVVTDQNHYDSVDNSDDKDTNRRHGNHHKSRRKLVLKPEEDLGADAFEPVGIFMGLEVLQDPSSYIIRSTASSTLAKANMKNNQAPIKAATAAAAAPFNSNTTTAKPTTAIVSEQSHDLPRKKSNKKKKKTTSKKSAAEDDIVGTWKDVAVPLPSAMAADSNRETKRPKRDAAKAAFFPPTEPVPEGLSRRQRKSAKRKGATPTAVAASTVKFATAVGRETTRDASRDDDDDDDTVAATAVNAEQRDRLEWNWTRSAGGVQWHPTLVQALLESRFDTPTPIQAATLAAAILGRRNIVGAAATGSGKTLAFLLPIYQYLLEQSDELKDISTNNNNSAVNHHHNHIQHDLAASNKLQALILTPTRELALQIYREGQKLASAVATSNQSHTQNHTTIGCLTGGLAVAKQTRVLQQQPPVLVATPGRLWELISSKQHPHLNDLSRIRFLVIDEADRMVTPGSFPELTKILSVVHSANPITDEDDDNDEEDWEDDDDEERMRGLPGIPGEARVTMLSDEAWQRLRDLDEPSTAPTHVQPEETDGGDDWQEEQQESEADNVVNKDDDDGDQISLPALPPVHRQTFVFSATLTLPKRTTTATKRKDGKKARAVQDVDGAIAEILEKARAVGPTKIVDLTKGAASNGAPRPTSSKSTTTDASSKATDQFGTTQFRLPPGLKLQQIKCTQMHKDSHLYAYLMTTVSGSAGPCLVFCNSIAAVRRVSATLQTLGLPVRMLHAHMQQRARFKAVESLQTGKARTVVVATDVAARGLDIPSVATVIHYDAARSIDTFVHRSGRTARGMGERAVGCSLSLIASGEDKFHAKIVNALKVNFAEVPMDGRLLSASQERVNLACKVASAEDVERKAQRDNQWFKDQAVEAGLEIDDDLLEDGLAGGDSRDKARLSEARLARKRLRSLLAQSLQTQRFGKFLSTNSASTQRVVPEPVFMPPARGFQKRKRRRGK